MEFKIDLNSEDINRSIAEAIAKSAIGEALEKIIKDKVSQLSQAYDNPIAKVVERFIADIIREIIETKYNELLKEWIAEKVTQEFTTAMFNKMWEAFTKRY